MFLINMFFVVEISKMIFTWGIWKCGLVSLHMTHDIKILQIREKLYLLCSKLLFKSAWEIATYLISHIWCLFLNEVNFGNVIFTNEGRWIISPLRWSNDYPCINLNIVKIHILTGVSHHSHNVMVVNIHVVHMRKGLEKYL